MLSRPSRFLASIGPPRLRVVPRGERREPQPSGGGGGAFRRGFTALRHRNYRYFWAGQMVSLVGTWMQSVSQPWLVLLLGGSPFQLGIVLALQFTPALLLAPLGGVLADRVDKRRVLMVVQAASMTQAAMLFALTVTGVVEIWHVMLLALLLGFVSAIEMPVRQSFAAELVPRDDLVNAIALNSASFNLARVLGPAVAGATLAVFGPAFNFGTNAVSYLAVLLGLSRMDPSKLHRLPQPARQGSVRSSLVEGVRYAARLPSVVWPLVLLGGVSGFGMNFQTLLPLYARDTLEVGAGGYGALFAIMGVGSLIGSLSIAFSGPRRPLIRVMLLGAAFFIAFELALGFTRDPMLAYPLVLLIGLSSMLMVNTINVSIQNSVSNELRGRVMALYVTVFAGSTPLGGFMAGAVAQLWGAPAAFVLGATAASIFVLLVAWQLVWRGAARADAVVERPATPGAESELRAAGE